MVVKYVLILKNDGNRFGGFGGWLAEILECYFKIKVSNAGFLFYLYMVGKCF